MRKKGFQLPEKGSLAPVLRASGGGQALDGFAETPGERVCTWYGTEDSELSVSARYYQLEDWVKSYDQAKNDKATYTDHFELTIRVIF